jgi:cysteine-rich repeat protein
MIICGNDRRDMGEECDDGNLMNGDGCSSLCENEREEPMCGDGTEDPGEACDEGDQNGTVCEPGYGNSCDYCTSTC